MNLRNWFHKHSLKLLAIRDTPQAIAGGVAIGVFFGFMPLFGFKTILAIFFAWITGSNILAAVVAGAMHDILLPLMPAVYLYEYKLGSWLLTHPHQWPTVMHEVHWNIFQWETWKKLFTGEVGARLMLGGAICSAPFAVLAFEITRTLVKRHQRKRKDAALPGGAL
jgi:uncharacterized protein